MFRKERKVLCSLRVKIICALAMDARTFNYLIRKRSFQLGTNYSINCQPKISKFIFG